MRSRQEIKAIGKERFKANYWPCVLAVLLVGIVFGVISGIGNIGAVTDFESGEVQPGPLSGVMGLVQFIISGPLEIGLCFFFVMNTLGRVDEITAATPITSCKENFGRKLGGYLWMELFTFLWSLLFVIPGIIKAYSYAMTPYILSDCPNVQAKDALKLSMRIMAGHKGELFVFHLSFIGWGILTALTAGILGIFYTGPYMNSAQSVWYLEAREDALRRGVITMGQLEGTEPVV
mgnify:CR=1 FL=1